LFQQGYPLHAAWTKPEIDVIHLAAALALIVLGMVFALVKVRHPRLKWTLAVIAVFVSLYTVAARQQIKPGQQPIIALDEAMQPPGVVLAATQLLEGRTVDIGGAGGSHVISINAPTDPDDTQAQQVWDYARRLAQNEHGGRLWLLSWFGVADESNWQERWLWQNASFIEQHTIDSETDEPHRAVLFDLMPAPEANELGGWNFGPVTLDTYGIATAADGVRITLQWSATQSPDTDYYWFVHLLDAQGNIVAQQDRAPQGGYMPTSAWDVGEPVVDRLFFPLAAGTDTAGWSLRIGWVDIENERLPVTDRDGAAVEDGFVIIGLGTM
ncbi:MAG: hypothetical protein H7175_18065, partial [Burkholderiales bacterium]|nr:hypothetical protein [Anaerolineae bacterium]